MAINAGIKVLVTRKIRDVPPNFDSRLDSASSESSVRYSVLQPIISRVLDCSVYRSNNGQPVV